MTSTSLPAFLDLSENAEENSIFDLVPVSILLEDVSGVLSLFKNWQSNGMTSLREQLKQPEYLNACLTELKILKVNRKTLELFEAASFEHFMNGITSIITAKTMGLYH